MDQSHRIHLQANDLHVDIVHGSALLCVLAVHGTLLNCAYQGQESCKKYQTSVGVECQDFDSIEVCTILITEKYNYPRSKLRQATVLLTEQDAIVDTKVFRLAISLFPRIRPGCKLYHRFPSLSEPIFWLQCLCY